MIEGEDFDREGGYAGNGGGRETDDVSGFEVFGVDVGEMEDEVLACDGPVGGCGVDFDGFYCGGFFCGHDEDGVADLNGTGVETTGYGERVLDTAAENVVNG